MRLHCVEVARRITPEDAVSADYVDLREAAVFQVTAMVGERSP